MHVDQLSSDKMKYLSLLSEQFPTMEALCTEIARLSARLSLPKGTEHFMSDIHGEYEAFCHIMNNCSGVIREKVTLWLGNVLSRSEEDELCTLIYYPAEILRQMHGKGTVCKSWYQKQVTCMLILARMLSSKYTRDKVRRAMTENWAFLLDELMHYQEDESVIRSEQEDNRRRYHDAIVDSLIDSGSVDGLMEALATLIKHLAVERLHVVGDIYDRGPRADSIMDILLHHHCVDIQWGNHDVLWMGAASGSECCIMGVLRNSLSYGNMDILERGYGIPLRPLSLMAEKLYPDMPMEKAMVHAVSVMMFKLEGQLILRNPDFQMEDRLLLDKMDLRQSTVRMDGEDWPLNTVCFPTVSSSDPYALSADEASVCAGLRQSFRQSTRLQMHVNFLYENGAMYRCHNGNLLYHGCVPLDARGQFLHKRLGDQTYSGKALMDYADTVARRAFYGADPYARDFMWYLWCGSDSPVCGRRIKTFARAFIPDERAWEEPRNPYYVFYNQEEKCMEILREFGLNGENACIVNGHTPIRVTHGESPLKAGGKLVVIDGGFCKAYQKTTGIAGYTLIANSHGMRLMSHQPFTSLKDAQKTGRDIHSQSFEFMRYPTRKYVADTDHGKRLWERREDLLRLLDACRNGTIRLEK
ncbi:MAG: fructose-1,6-bisphosphatase [Clostridia bacterium]|nr:fructose-1,6-bisphosphatase [Clostridia bacterium]